MISLLKTLVKQLHPVLNQIGNHLMYTLEQKLSKLEKKITVLPRISRD